MVGEGRPPDEAAGHRESGLRYGTETWRTFIWQTHTADTHRPLNAKPLQFTQKLAQHKQTIRERNFTIAEAHNLLDTLTRNNRETELKLSASRQQAFRLQQQAKEQERSCGRLKDEVSSAARAG